jgi:hypothetical protein
MWARTTTPRHPAPSSYRNDVTLLSLKNMTAEPKNSVHTGASATKPVTNVTFMPVIV